MTGLKLNKRIFLHLKNIKTNDIQLYNSMSPMLEFSSEPETLFSKC